MQDLLDLLVKKQVIRKYSVLNGFLVIETNDGEKISYSLNSN